MNEAQIRFLDMFSDYEPDSELAGALEHALVQHAEIGRDSRFVKVGLSLSSYVNPGALDRLREEVARRYGLSGLELKAIYDVKLLEASPDFLTGVMVRAYPPAAAILAGARWSFSEGVISLQLKANGKKDIEDHGYIVAGFIREHFGLDVRLEIESSNPMTAEETFQHMETVRREVIKQAVLETPAAAPKKESKGKSAHGQLIFGRPPRGEATPMDRLDIDMNRVTVCGEVFAVEHRELKKRGAHVVLFDMTDYSGSVRVSKFMEDAEAAPIIEKVKKGMWLTVSGRMNMNRFDNEMVLEPAGVAVARTPAREDSAEHKRVELHLHTRMSQMDALTDTEQAVALAANWGHKAVAITDHGVVQSFPDAMKAGKKHGVKIIYGCEAYFVNDVDDRIVVQGQSDAGLDGEFVCFDLETTGLDSVRDEITEIGAVIYADGKLGERFQTFVNPGRKLDRKIVELTGITDDMLEGAPGIQDALRDFITFCGNRPLVAHNADFDVGFLTQAAQRYGVEFDPVYLDTLAMAQNLLPDLSKHKLNVVADALGLPEFNHHRAVDDAVTVAHMLARFLPMLIEKGVERLDQVNSHMRTLRSAARLDKRGSKHLIILAKDQTGVRNLYKLVSLAHLEYFKRTARIPKSLLDQNREGLILGTACESGELFSAIVAGKSWRELKRIASYYDYLEIQPICNNEFLYINGTVDSREALREFNRTVVRLGEELGKPVVATGDVHFLNPTDEEYRKVLLATKGFDDADRHLPLYYKSTDEMLEEFSYLGAEKAFEVVVTNPNAIADMCQETRPVPVGLFTPRIKNSAEDLKRLVEDKTRLLYGDDPPQIVAGRVKTELDDIIGCKYDVIYMSAQKLVAKSNEDGYLVGSRGSVGSSIVAYMAGITEVNSFSAHYRCPECRHSEFDVPEGYSCGADLPDKDCPVCGARYEKDGFDIPFETFLGFGGDKVPDIDLNFSGEYQAKAHKYTFELFGQDHVFRAGTISTVAEKTAYGYAKKYLEERGRNESKAEENRLAKGCVGVKRTTGQHPGGLVVIPDDKEIWDFCPVQRPADSTDSDITTTHFEYHSMEDNLLKLDLLGHDDPTMIRMLQDLTGVDPTKIPLDDGDTMSLFTSPMALGLEPDDVLGQTGACAIPEFGTKFVREMLVDTKPERFETLVQISGFSHGTDVWLNNAKDLLTSGTAQVKDLISCRDDIMLYLITRGMDEKLSFKIMEAVRKGKGLQEEWVQVMQANGVPRWYIDSCNKIKYLFPKAHAVAYVIMAFRIAWFKVHRPLAFYAAYFTIRAVAFDAAVMTAGLDTVSAKMRDITNNPNASPVEKDMLTTLEVCYEFYKRGYSFEPVDLYQSDAARFLIEENGLRPPFVSVSGLGETAARNLAEARKGKRFISVDELSDACPKLSKTHIEQLKTLGALGGLPDTSQMTLF